MTSQKVSTDRTKESDGEFIASLIEPKPDYTFVYTTAMLSASNPSNASVCNFAADNTFGPQVDSCRGRFDFTLLFEQSILSLGPCLVFILIFPFRLKYLCSTSTKTVRGCNLLRTTKITLITVFGCLQLALLVSWSLFPQERTKASITASAISVLTSVGLCVLSYLEHSKSLRPSTLLNLYLFISLGFDAVQARTLWLIGGNSALCAIFTTSLAVKMLLLGFEAKEKRGLLRQEFCSYPPESLGGIFNRSFFWWLNTLLLLGFSKDIAMTDLFSTDPELASDPLKISVISAWEKAKQKNKYALIYTTILHSNWTFLSAIIPRLCLTGFKFSQPFLITHVIAFVQDSVENGNTGYGLIGATALIYIGISISKAFSNHQVYRAITMMRGALIGLIYEKTIDLSSCVPNDSAAVTLMSTDIDRIAAGFTLILELWASPLEMILGVWLLQRQIGFACFGPVLIALISTFGSSIVARYVGNRQKTWVKAVQVRVAVTRSVLASMKSVKMLGLEDVLSTVIQSLRSLELNLSKPFRMMIVYINIFGTLSIVLSPAISFMIFVLYTNSSLQTDQAFTSLSLIALLTSPVDTFSNAVTRFTSAVGCFERIQAFLLSQSRKDGRSTKALPPSKDFKPQIQVQQSDYELNHLLRPHSEALSRDNELIQVENCSIGYLENGPAVVKEASVNFRKSDLNMIIGPVGSGKSTFLKALLGETVFLGGCVHVQPIDIAYCQQNPWLINSTIRENIAGQTDFDKTWYEEVLESCALDRELVQFPKGDKTLIGSNGSALSGGQRQRVALARAIYSRKEVFVLDDILSALDENTSKFVFNRVFGKQGLFRKLRATVILATHTVRYMREADHLVILQKDGVILEQGHFDDLTIFEPQQKRTMESGQKSESTEETVQEPLDPVPFEGVKESSETISIASKDNSQQQPSRSSSAQLATSPPSSVESPKLQTKRYGDLSLYGIYIKSIGIWRALLTLLFTVCYVFCFAFPQIWLEWWVASNGKRNEMYLGVYIAFAVAAVISFGVYIWYFLVVTVPRSSEKLHYYLLKTVLRAPLSFFTSTDSGVTLNRFSQDMSLIDMSLPVAYAVTFESAITAIAQIILIAIGARYIATLIPICIFAIWAIQKFYLRTSRQIRILDLEAKSPLYTHFMETIEGLTTIRAFGWQEKFQQRSSELLDTSQKPFYLLYCIQRWLGLILDLLVAGLAVVLVTMAVRLTNLTGGGAIGVSLVNVLGINQTLVLLINNWTQLETSLGAIARLKVFMDTTESEDLEDEIQQLPSNWPKYGSIKFENVSASYSVNSRNVLQDVSLSISAGQKIGICGRTGNGKSSLLASLFRLTSLTSGSIKIDDIDISKLPRRAIRSSLIAIPQDSLILPGTVRFNLSSILSQDMLAIPSDTEMITALSKVQLWPTISNQGDLDTEMKNISLSHGEQQLFCLARALLKVKKSNILVLDEATSGIDATTDSLMQDVIKQEFKDHTVITVAHRLESIMDSDWVAVMDCGTIVEEGKPVELLKKKRGAFGDLYRSQK